jgi:GTP-binding protein HflX
VGYTNAGKSTLFNALVKAQTYAADQLFATLDTTTRQLYLGELLGVPTSVSLSDTVGFIRDLPHTLVDAFEATLQEAAQADLLLHVVDASNANWAEQLVQVQRVLADIGAAEVEQWLIFNKIDALDPVAQPSRMVDHYEFESREFKRIFLSAASGEGLPKLRESLAQWAFDQIPLKEGEQRQEQGVFELDPLGRLH